MSAAGPFQQSPTAPCLLIRRLADILPPYPAAAAKARLWAELWGANVGPAQVRRGSRRRRGSPLNCTQQLGARSSLAACPASHSTRGHLCPPCCCLQSAVLQSDTKAKLEEAERKLVGALTVGAGWSTCLPRRRLAGRQPPPPRVGEGRMLTSAARR